MALTTQTTMIMRRYSRICSVIRLIGVSWQSLRGREGVRSQVSRYCSPARS